MNTSHWVARFSIFQIFILILTFQKCFQMFFIFSQITNLSKGNVISNARKEILGMPESPNVPTIPQLFFLHWALQGCGDSVQWQLPVRMWGRLEIGACPWHGSGALAGAGCSTKASLKRTLTHHSWQKVRFCVREVLPIAIRTCPPSKQLCQQWQLEVLTVFNSPS